MAARYSVVSTSPLVYIDKSGQVVNGVLVRFNILPYDESHEVRLPKLDTALVKKEIEKAVAARDELADLGEIE